MKKQNTILSWVGIALFCIIFLTIWGCAPTGQQVVTSSNDDVADIDQLLGLEDEEETIQEDDVLRLLGVVDDEEENSYQASEQSGANVETQPAGSMHWTETGSSSKTEPSLAYQDSQTRPVPQTTVKSASDYESQYQQGRQLYNSKQYREAIQLFESLLEQNGSHSLSDNCQYWIGESYYGMGKYQMAIVAFQKVFSFPQSNKLADAQLKVGLSYWKLNDKERAREELQKLIDNYPSSQYVSIARRSIDQIDQDIQ